MDQAINLAISNASTQRGFSATFYHVDTEGSFDPSTGKTTPTKTSETVKAMFSEYNASQIDGQVIKRTDVKATVSASEFNSGDPTVDDEIEDRNGNTYTVVSVKSKLVEHNPVSFELQLRQ